MTLTSRRLRAFLSAVAVVALTAGLLVAYGQFRSEPDQPGIEARGPKTTQPPAAAATPTATPDADAGEAGGESADELNEEAQEQAEGTEKRHEAFEKAKAAGKTGQQRPTGAGVAAPAAGWAGEFPMDTQWDDWEPAIAADPNSGFVYVIATRYAAPKPCPGNCPSPVDGGRGQPGWRRDVGQPDAAVRLPGQGPVRPDHRGRPAATATCTRST